MEKMTKETASPRRWKPTLYDASWMPDKVIELMAEGASKMAVAAALGINRRTLYLWIDSKNEIYDDFKEAIEMGETLSQAWWEETGRKGMFAGSEFNTSSWIYNMKCRFREDWYEKNHQENTGSVTVTWPLGKSELDE